MSVLSKWWYRCELSARAVSPALLRSVQLTSIRLMCWHLLVAWSTRESPVRWPRLQPVTFNSYRQTYRRIDRQTDRQTDRSLETRTVQYTENVVVGGLIHHINTLSTVLVPVTMATIVQQHVTFTWPLIHLFVPWNFSQQNLQHRHVARKYLISSSWFICLLHVELYIL